MEKETLYKSRSFSSCIQAAYKLMSDNLKGIVRSTWLPVLILGVSTSLLVTLNIPSPSILEFGISHTALFFTLVGVALLGMILCSVWAMSRLMSMLNEHSRWWNFKRVLIATLNFTAIFIVTYGILVAAFYWGIRYTGGSPAHFVNDNYLVVLVVSLLFILALLPLCYIIMRYLYDHQATFWREFPRTYTTGLRHLGFIFLTALLIGIIVVLLVVSFLLAKGTDVDIVKYNITEGTSKLIGAACILVYIIVIGAALSILVTEVMPKSNKKK